MKCQGDEYCEKEAGYKVKIKKEEGNGKKYRGGYYYLYVCGYCLVGWYISSSGLKEDVLEVARL